VNKFCFDTSGPGRAIFDFGAQTTNGSYFLIFDDITWNDVYTNPGYNCVQRSQSPIIPPIPIGPFTMNITVDVNDHSRPYYWYFAVSNCDVNSVTVDYSAQFYQFQANWNRQFSFDEQGLEAMYLVFFILFILLVAAQLISDVQFWMAGSFHPLIRLLTGSLLCEFFAFFFYLIHYGVYSTNGTGNAGCLAIGQLLDMFATISFIGLIVLIANGWGISEKIRSLNEVEFKKRVAIIAGTITFVVLYLILYFTGLYAVDPAIFVYYYETAPGQF